MKLLSAVATSAILLSVTLLLAQVFASAAPSSTGLEVTADGKTIKHIQLNDSDLARLFGEADGYVILIDNTKQVQAFVDNDVAQLLLATVFLPQAFAQEEATTASTLDEPTTWTTIAAIILALVFKMLDGNKIKSIGRKADRSRAGSTLMCDIFTSYDDIVQKFVAASADGTVDEKEWKGILNIVEDRAPKLKARFDGLRDAMEIDDRVH